MQNISMNHRVDNENVQRKAYELWISGGCRDGVAEQNWLEAEKILSSTEASISTHATPVSQPPSAPRAAAPVQVPAIQTFQYSGQAQRSGKARPLEIVANLFSANNALSA